MDYLIALIALASFGYIWRVGVKHFPISHKWLKELVSFACGVLVLLTIFSLYLVPQEKSNSASSPTVINQDALQLKEQ